MAEYVEREALIAWLKRIQLKDLSDGRGLCRVIFEEDFKHAIRTLPDGAIADVAPVIWCEDCQYWQDNNGGYPNEECRWREDETPDADDFCSYGKRMDGDSNDS